MGDVTRLLESMQGGNGQAGDELLALVYGELRRIPVESARRKQSLKRGGNAERVELEENLMIQSPPSDEVLAVHEDLDLLAAKDPVSVELVKLLYFARMTMEEAAAMGVSKRTAESRWTHARTWLRRVIEDDRRQEPN
jgi:predicted DNA-binding protein (UPF0251 family)